MVNAVMYQFDYPLLSVHLVIIVLLHVVLTIITVTYFIYHECKKSGSFCKVT